MKALQGVIVFLLLFSCKKNVLSLLKTSKNHPFSDTISVVDDEASSSVKLLFAKDKLKRIIILPW